MTQISCFLCLVFLAGCQGAQIGKEDRGVSDVCISPLATFSYSTTINPEMVPGETEMQIPPKWDVEKDIPTDYYLTISRKTESGIELWFEQNSPEQGGLERPRRKLFHIYNTIKGSFETVSGEVDGSGIYVEALFIDPIGHIWAKNDLKEMYSNYGTWAYPLLSQFDEQQKTFKFVEGSEIADTWGDGYNAENYQVTVKMGKDGVFWFFNLEGGIYNFNPGLNEIRKSIDTPDIHVASPVFSQDGIYFIDQMYLDKSGVLVLSNDIRLFRFSPEENRLEQVPFRINPWPPFTSLVYDHRNRLWLGGVAYFDENGNLFQLELPPIFITNSIESGMEYRWSTPHLVMESSDGKIWYRTVNGLAWLDLESQKWCWVSTSLSNIIEDQNHTLWMTAYGKLYKKEIIPIN